MGETCTILCRQGRFRAYYAPFWSHWGWSCLSDGLSEFHTFVVSFLLDSQLTKQVRFYGFKENKREVEMDMREMVDKVKKGEPLYGVSTTTPYIQGMASRNSRYSGLFLHVIPWFNFVNHNQHGVDTAKYYQQAERELEAEKTGKE
jgi:hypothetical protein